MMNLDTLMRQRVIAVRDKRARMAENKELAEDSLYEFIKMFWHCVEPEKPFSESWTVQAMCEHLEAVTNRDINRLIINIPPGFSKSLTVDVWWSAWEWGPRNMPHMRYICTSSQAYLTERDNARFLRVINDPVYRRLWGDRFTLDLTGVSNITNDKTGFKLATTVGGISTGARAGRVIIDDPNSTDPAKNESEIQREGINNWLMEVMPDRLNSIEEDAIVLIQQRTHESDATATLLDRGQDYVHLCIPMEYDPQRHCETEIGWSDPRTEVDELAWPERFSPEVIRKLKIEKGPVAWAGQYSQSPITRGGNIIKQDWWKLYDMAYAQKLGLLQEGAKKLVYPTFDLTVVSVDTALTEKKENCYSGCTVWGIWKDENNVTKIMLIYAWQERLSLHGVTPEDGATKLERKAKQGLVEKIAETAKQWKAQAILIEAKANGEDVINEMARLYRKEPWQVIPINPKGDKVARVHATVPTFTQGLVYAPDKEWAQKVINQTISFPRGKDKDLCFVSGTKIATDKGDVNIEDMRIGYRVLTPDGFKRVVYAGCTGNSDVISRCGLTGTKDHRILSLDITYQQLYDIHPSHIIRLSLWNLILCTSLEALFSTDVLTNCWEKGSITLGNIERPTVNSAFADCMLMFGNFILERQFQKAMTLITKIAIRSIRITIILNVYRWQCIVQCLKEMWIERNLKNIWRGLILSLLNGISLKKVVNGIGNMLKKALIKGLNLLIAYADYVEKNLSQNLSMERSFVATTANRKRSTGINLADLCVQLRLIAANVENLSFLRDGGQNKYAHRSVLMYDHQEKGKMPVYNLQAEGTPCYFANGVLVHNCDSATQALLYLRNAGIIMRPDEERDELAARLAPQGKEESLYPVY